jgi:hypothetical protein
VAVSVRIGLAVATDAVRGVAVHEGGVVWGGEVPADDTRTLTAVLSELLAAMPVRRWPRPAVVAAVGPAHSQLRRLTGLPPVADDRTLTRLVGQSTSRFFLRNGVPLVTTGVLRDGDGEAWGGAIEQPVVAELEAACRANGFRLAAVLPALAVLSNALEGDALTWCDGDVRAELTIAAGRLRTLRRTVVPADAIDAPAVDQPRAVTQLAETGAEAWRFADAYGAAVASARDPLAYRPARSASATPVPAWRLAIAGAACVLSLLAALVAPSLAARQAANRATDRLSAMAVTRRAAVAAETDLGLVTGALEELAAFDRDRRSSILLLAALTRSLPKGSALVALRADSTGGTLVALAPRAALVMAALEGVPNLASPTIIGPITREVAGRAEVERVTVRFSWAGAPASRSAP